MKYLALGLLVLVIAVTRSHHFDRSLWVDESWVANSILAASYQEMFRYEYWIQTTPPFLLVAARWLIQLTGPANWAFRLIPLVFGMGGVLLLTRFAARTLGLPLGLVCGGMAAVSTGVQFSKDLKQYAAEFFFGVLFLNLALDLPALPFARRTVLLAAAIVLAVGFGFPSLAYLPVTLMALLLHAKEKRFATVGIGAAAAAGALALLYLLYLAPNSAGSLKSAWASQFPRTLDPVRLASFYGGGFRQLFLQHLWVELVRPPAARYALIVPALAGAVRGVLALRRPAPETLVSLGAGLPVAGAIAANLAGLYPFWYERFSHYLLPSILLLVTLGLHAGLELIRRPLPLWIPTALLAGLAALSLDASRWPPRHFEQIEEALGYLEGHARVTRGDLLYVHVSLSEPMRLYRRMRHWERAEIWFGGTQGKCCAREPDRLRLLEDPKLMREDFEQMQAASLARRKWMLYTARKDYWGFLQRNEERIHAQWLAEAGCKRESARQFPNISLSSWTCPVR